MNAGRHSAIAGAVLGLILAAGPALAGDRAAALAEEAGLRAYPVPMRAPDFRLPTWEGGTAGIADYRDRVVLLAFWASWCSVCRGELPSLIELQNDYGGERFTVLMVAVRDNPGDAARVLPEGTAFPVLFDDSGGVAERYRAAGVPVNYVLDGRGRMLAGQAGAFHWNGEPVRRLIEHLMDALEERP